jgi:ankyrin repeat protein
VLRKSLASLPPTLDRTYDRILSAINKEDSEYAIRILQWLTFSARPLSIDEVAEVVAIDIEHDPTFDGDEILEDPLDILNICSGLVTMNVVEDQWQKSPRRIVALAHYSVKEYLLSDRIWKGEAAQYGMQDTICHEVIARGCLGYLFQFQQPELDSDNFPEIFKLATYSAEFWVSHAHKTGDRIKNISQVAIRLFSTENPAYLNWIRLYNPDTHWPDFPMSREKISHPLYYAALLGLRDVVSLLLENGSDPNEVLGGYYGNPLNAASHQGHEQVVNLLLNKGADPNPQGKEDGNPLYAAVVQGHEHILKLLLDKGADPNVRDGDDDNPLYKAVERGHEQVVKLLLDKGANPNTQVRYYHNPLYTASEEGYEQVVKLLLDKGADPNVEGGEYGNALQAASHRGHDQVVKLLLNKGADMNAQSGHYGNPLYTASERGHEQVVKLLLAKGANANAQSGYYGNPLQAALERGHKQVVKLLIDKDARSTSGEDMSTRT